RWFAQNWSSALRSSKWQSCRSRDPICRARQSVQGSRWMEIRCWCLPEREGRLPETGGDGEKGFLDRLRLELSKNAPCRRCSATKPAFPVRLFPNVDWLRPRRRGQIERHRFGKAARHSRGFGRHWRLTFPAGPWSGNLDCPFWPE